MFRSTVRSILCMSFPAFVLIMAIAPQVAATELGARRGPGCDGRAAMGVFETFVGRKVEHTVDAFNQKSWKDLELSIPWLARCWKGTDIALTVSVPMLTQEGPGTLADGAGGKYDAIFARMADQLIKAGLEESVIRIGWEFNGNWQPWAASSDPESYKLYFRRIVDIMRAAEGQKFRFEWCVAHGKNAMDPEVAYPGDDVVDIIAMDVYAGTWDAETADPIKRWQSYIDRPFGLAWLRDFAAARKKPVSFPEWGAGTRPDGHGVGDDPVFIAGMADWIEQTRPLYQSYWDVKSAEYNSQLSNGQFPNAAREFQRRFGAEGLK